MIERALDMVLDDVKAAVPNAAALGVYRGVTPRRKEHSQWVLGRFEGAEPRDTLAPQFTLTVSVRVGANSRPAWAALAAHVMRALGQYPGFLAGPEEVDEAASVFSSVFTVDVPEC